MIDWLRRRAWLIELPLASLALALGLPVWISIAAGRPAADWPVPFSFQMTGDFGLRTAVYLSGFLVAFALIELAAMVGGRPLLGGGRGDDRPAAAPTAGPARSGHPPAEDPDRPVSVVEPFYGFLPGRIQQDLARRSGYNALLYTKVSILLSGGIGVLLAGSWDPAGPFAPFTPQTSIRIAAGLYLIAESAHRYIHFARREPAGSLIGTVVHAATAPLHRT